MAAVAAAEERGSTGTGVGCAWLVRYSVTFHYGKDGGCPKGQAQCGVGEWGEGAGNCKRKFNSFQLHAYSQDDVEDSNATHTFIN